MQHLHNRSNSGRKFFSVMSAFVMSLCLMIPTSSMADYTEYDISTQSEVSVYDEYLSWSQLDERWCDTPMGGSSTIRNAGCLMTSLAIMAMDSGSIDDTALENMGIADIEQFNPKVLVESHKKVKGLFPDGSAVWGAISKFIPQIEWCGDRFFASTEKMAVAEEINGLMNEGCYIVALLKDVYHWVYIKDVLSDGTIIMCDPAKNETDLYKVYPNGLEGEFWCLKGKNPPRMNEQSDKTENNIITLTEKVEYFVQSGEPVEVFSEINGNSISATLTPGNVVSVSAYCENYGFIESSDFIGWVDLNMLSQTELAYQITGDINNDGSVDKYDLALLNTYLQQKKSLADGVSTLSKSELNAADMNYDGIVDSNDVVALIKSINK